MKVSGSLAACLLSVLITYVTAAPNPRVLPTTAQAEQYYSNNTFDYIIVGGGTAGLAIAARLAENPSLSVAVVEAGSFYEEIGNLSTVPAYWLHSVGTDASDVDPRVDWGFFTTPQTVSDEPYGHLISMLKLLESQSRNPCCSR